MSCSIEESSTTTTTTILETNTLNQLNQPQASSPLINPYTTAQSNSNSNSSSNLMTATTNQNSKPNLMNMINVQNTNHVSNNTNNGNSQKIVSTGLGNQLIITKLVTVTNNSNNSTNSSVASSSSTSSSSSSASSVGSTSPQSSSSNLNLLQSSTPILQAAINGTNQQQQQASSSNMASSSTNSISPPNQIRNTITLSDPAANNTSTNTSNSNQNNNNQVNYSMQQQHQFSQFVDTNDGSSGQGVSFSPLNCSNSMQQNTNSYYTYQNDLKITEVIVKTTPQQQTYAQQQPQQTLLTTNLNILTNPQQQGTTTVSLQSPPTTTNLTNAITTSDFQQQQQQQIQNQQQQQQPVYYMYEEPSMEGQPIEFEGHVAHTAQAAPITVQWLIDNFEPAEGCSLRRSTLYNYYLHHCTEQKLEPVNPASFGKLIRSVFLGLRTRRLGTRGNSKYHYYGIRVKVTSPLNQLSEDHTFAIRNHPMSLSPTGSPGPHQPPQSPNTSAPATANNNNNKFTGNQPAAKRAKQVHFNNNNNPNLLTDNSNMQNNEYKPIITNENPQQQPPPVMAVIINNGNMVTKTAPQTTTIAKTLKQNDNRSNIQQMPHQHQQQPHQANSTHDIKHMNENNQQQQQQQHQNSIISGTDLTEEELNNMLAGNKPQIPEFATLNLDRFPLPPNCTIDDVKKFQELYKYQCEKILELVVALKLLEIENVLHMFWRSPLIQHKFYEDELSTQKFMSLCEVPEIIEYTKQCDYQFYQFCIEILIPDVLGTLPTNLVQSIRQLAKHLDSWIRNALTNVPEAMKQSKMQIINTLSMTLRRYTSLNHLANTVKNSLQNENILSQMLHDITKVDFAYIKEQAKWTCDCDERMINRFEKEFKESLSNYTSTMDNWITWLDSSVKFYLQQFEGTDRYAKMAKQFLLKWSFLCSSIIRDLTLRSAASFGSFHLIRLLYDEYMYYIIEHKIAAEFNLSALAVMGCEELRPLSNLSNPSNLLMSNEQLA